MDEYTFIAEDQPAQQIEGAPAAQSVSAEQMYRNELAQEMQVLFCLVAAVICQCP